MNSKRLRILLRVISRRLFSNEERGYGNNNILGLRLGKVVYCKVLDLAVLAKN